MYYEDHIKRAVRKAAGFPEFADFMGMDAAAARQLIRFDDDELTHLTPLGALYLRESGQLEDAPDHIKCRALRLARQA